MLVKKGKLREREGEREEPQSQKPNHKALLSTTMKPKVFNLGVKIKNENCD